MAELITLHTDVKKGNHLNVLLHKFHKQQEKPNCWNGTVQTSIITFNHLILIVNTLEVKYHEVFCMINHMYT